MHEKISALLDGELDEVEQRELLKLISKDSNLSAVWQRYHLIGAAVRNERMVYLPNLSDRLQHKLARERGVVVRLRRWVPHVAIAASIGALVVFGWLSLAPTQQVPVAAAPTDIAQIDEEARWQTPTPELEQDLNTFLVEHGEFSQLSGMNGLMAYAKFVSYDASR